MLCACICIHLCPSGNIAKDRCTFFSQAVFAQNMRVVATLTLLECGCVALCGTQYVGTASASCCSERRRVPH